MSTLTPARCRTLSASEHHIRSSFARLSTKLKLLMSIVVIGVLMTMYTLMWTAKSEHSKFKPSEFGRPGMVIRKLSTPSLIKLQHQRMTHMSKRCDSLINSGNISMSLNVSRLAHIIVDDQYRLLYCYVPKVGCSNWKRIFLHMTGMFDKTRKRPEDITHDETHFKYAKRLHFLRDYSIPGIYNRLQNYRKFMFTREPMERLLSAYRDKFAGVGFEDETFQKIAYKIYEMYYPGSKGDVEKGAVSFLDFVKYLVDEKQFRSENFHYDEHWDRQSELCLPCQINYDFIGKYETLEEDANFILERSGLSRYTFPKRSTFYNATRTNETILKYFSEIPGFYRKKLQKFYQSDYVLFGYEFPFD